MENSHQALWDKCLHLIEANVTEQQFKTWFAPIVFELRQSIRFWCRFQVCTCTSTWSSTTLDY